ncbi:conserved hypothetical protein [Culex quinquefasciatus]|uniref:Uncharacterized protein n=1 Tax=Culex quinquefasciatus TaxID=7176 RepID=B0WTM8_CULQU|nr:conserved hypothetical protein [Culex quinquefasciatus]|eukprot:XP_001854913.1 conserved hypothetical protein [Culex quinquefasciatus]
MMMVVTSQESSPQQDLCCIDERAISPPPCRCNYRCFVRFMLRFDMLQLDCNDHLFVYDGAHAVGSHKTCIQGQN